ncbi:MAG: hypothetical protein QM790_11615 [Nibricoccus sp.]
MQQFVVFIGLAKGCANNMGENKTSNPRAAVVTPGWSRWGRFGASLRFGLRGTQLRFSSGWLVAAVLVMVPMVTLVDAESSVERNSTPAVEAGESHVATAPANVPVGDKKEVEFVLAEVRKQLEPNPATAVVEIAIDPEYRQGEHDYLVSAVLDSGGRKIYIGVMVRVEGKDEHMKASLAYLD